MSDNKMHDENNSKIKEVFNELRECVRDKDSDEYILGFITVAEHIVNERVHWLATLSSEYVVKYNNLRLEVSDLKLLIMKTQSIPISELEEVIKKHSQWLKYMAEESYSVDDFMNDLQNLIDKRRK